jgi:DNA-binding winged helix-turn-helix (wHTH) protein
MTIDNQPVFSFGPYRLLAARRLLLKGDKPVPLGSRAFDILTALVERAGQVVRKEELMARAWPKTFVDDANLKIQIGALRRALGDGQGNIRYVVTVVGRGYVFAAPTREEEPSQTSPSPTIAPVVRHNLPLATMRMIGREGSVATLVTQRLSRQRLVTVAGSGGIGNTTVALAVAERMMGACEHGVWLVNLAPLRDPDLVPSAVATALGLEISSDDPLPGLVAALRESRALLLLDNCEHVINATADLATAVLRGTPDVKILATSREPLGVLGERVFRVGPLNSPEPSSKLTAAEAAGMSETPSLRPAQPDEIAEALAFALQHDGRRRVHQADSFICRIAAERLVKQLGQSGFVVMKRPPAPAHSTSNHPHFAPWRVAAGAPAAGDVRTIQTIDGKRIIERLEEMDDAQDSIDT